MAKQTTLKSEITLQGVGLHTGASATMRLLPADADYGFKFIRTDLPGNPVIPADVSKVVSTQRGTTLQVGEAKISTVEHLLAALAGLQVDNVEIQIDGPEIPILDGSSKPYTEAIQKVGINELDAERDVFEITSPIVYKDPETGSEIVALPNDRFEVTALIDFQSPTLGKQFASLKDISDFASEIAPCRTFVFLHEIEFLFSQGLIKGGDLDNAIVIADRPISDEKLSELAQKLQKPDLKIDKKTGILNTLDLQFPNETARHKLLDVIGDVALLGVPIKGKIVATKPGHGANTAFTKLLRESYLEYKKTKNIPVYDIQKEPVLSAQQIEQWLPHRYPFLMVDKIIELNNEYVVGVKNITMNEPFFQGHFPGNPIMPGVLQIEAMAQVGGILALHISGDPGQWDTYFLKIEQAKFKAKVVPGDTVIIKMELLAPIRRGICQMRGIAYVGNKVVSEADLTAQIVKR